MEFLKILGMGAALMVTSAAIVALILVTMFKASECWQEGRKKTSILLWTILFLLLSLLFGVQLYAGS